MPVGPDWGQSRILRAIIKAHGVPFHFVPVGPTCCSNCKDSDKLRIKHMLAKALLLAYVLSTCFMCCNSVSDSIAT